MSCAFEELFSIRDAFRGIPMAGRTDTWIVADAAVAHGIPLDSPALAHFPRVYAKHLERELHYPGSSRKGTMPGVRELLDALSPIESACLALLTGNYEAGARLKLEYFDLWRYFRCGAFGDNAPDRNRLLPRALARAAACGKGVVSPADAIIIGDTPLDIACAKAGGARSIGVATGSHSVEQLREAGADIVFEDLSDTEAVLSALLPSFQ
jgi:phosphoglycolate phosphatase-like HAD superfamily hydrolase